MKRHLFILGIFAFLFLLSSFAVDIFFDGFESGTLNGWLVFGTGNPWVINTTNAASGVRHAEDNPRNTLLGSTLLKNLSLVGYANLTVSYQRRLIG